MGGVDSAFRDNINLRVQQDKMIRADETAKAIWFLYQQPASGVVSEAVLQAFNHLQFDTAKSSPLKSKIFYPDSHFIIRSFLLPLPS